MRRMTRSQKLDQLVSSVEDLLAQLPNDLTPAVAELRDKVDAGIFDAWTCIAREAVDAPLRAESSPDKRIWTTVGLALLGASGLLAYQLTRTAARPS